MLIDSHQHYWQIGKHGHEWPGADLTAIYRDFGVEDFLHDAAGLAVSGTVLVQSQPCDADTDWLLEMAHHDLIKGVVGWVDLESSDATSRLIELSHHQKFKGVRPMLQSLPDDNWILNDSVKPALDTISELNLCFDALVFTQHLAAIAVLAHRWPQLHIIIDHAAKPPIAERSIEATQQWYMAIAHVAKYNNVSCKLSGLFTEMRLGQSYSDASPYAEHVLNIFGAERVMWGSDWPVLTLRDTYPRWHTWVMDRISHLSSLQQAAVMGGNAQRIYRL